MQAGFSRLSILAVLFFSAASFAQTGTKDNPITGAAAYADWSQQKPGIFRKITVNDLPKPFATESVDNGPEMTARPEGAIPQAPPGFKVELYADGLNYPREIRTAPDGDIFLAESRKGEIMVFRGVNKDGKAAQV